MSATSCAMRHKSFAGYVQSSTSNIIPAQCHYRCATSGGGALHIQTPQQIQTSAAMTTFGLVHGWC
jgi:hypothetical protein